MNSMTGYGSSEVITSDGKVTVEARSENHRFLDIKILLPDYLEKMEYAISDHVKKHLSRGKVKILITFEEIDTRTTSLNRKSAEKCFGELKKLRKLLKIEDKITLDHLISFKEIFNGYQGHHISKTTERKINSAVRKAVTNLDKSRKEEGRKHAADLDNRIGKCCELLEKIKARRSDFTSESMKKLKEKVETLISGKDIDQSRMYQEIAILSEKTDITEEIVRLEAHFEKFRETTKRSSPSGKELDFLLLEMNREASTISAKSKNAGISHFTISLRSEFEKMREQVQNIE